ncbi:Gfo/Idh/MocA family oxidoreductase [Bacillaceae bacterium SIJ1]|uniref:Gfo/Idh/MocA family protein n=1 Tax=Litoribacterium kuwaitense TaxID=1398745 RepID=UPI0013EC7DE8|nr:Gfo/Idh/MocA family oxidoreductase [Litoribacterium kuwaitense]NGP46139.1 Gfo/Idh/MocA family oxidoreductase [Litoribacterium kuwaitense]
MVGYSFMGKAHTQAYRDVSYYFDTPATPVLKAIAGRNEDKVKDAAEKLGFESYETDWRKLIERDDIDVVDIVTPNLSHAEIAIAAAKAGKHVICEKPLAMSVNEAQAMLKAVEEAGVIHMISHNYRFAPAVQYAKQLIAEGKLGKIHHFRGVYLQDWLLDPKAPIAWRMKKEMSGYGTHGDIAAHSIDLARFLVGEINEVAGLLKTFVHERPLEGSPDKMETVDVDDASAFIAQFDNGAMGVFEASRFAGGNRNGNRFEINGEKGSIKWDLENLNNLHVYFDDDAPGQQGFRLINCTEAEHPYAGAYWPSGHILGYEHTFINLIHDLIESVANGKNPTPNFKDGVQNQKVLEAVAEASEKKSWVSIES